MAPGERNYSSGCWEVPTLGLDWEQLTPNRWLTSIHSEGRKGVGGEKKVEVEAFAWQ